MSGMQETRGALHYLFARQLRQRTAELVNSRGPCGRIVAGTMRLVPSRSAECEPGALNGTALLQVRHQVMWNDMASTTASAFG